MIETDFFSYKPGQKDENMTQIYEVKKTVKYKKIDLQSGVAEFLNLMDPTLPKASVLEKLKTLNFNYAEPIDNKHETIYKIEIYREDNSAIGHIFLSKKNLSLKEIKVEYF